MPRRETVSCLVSSFDGDLKRDFRRYRTMTIDSASSRGSSRSTTSSRKRYSPPAPPCKRCTTILEEDEIPGGLREPEPCHIPGAVPPGTAWASDWDALAAETSIHRNDSVSDYGSAASTDRGGDVRQPPPAIIITPSP